MNETNIMKNYYKFILVLAMLSIGITATQAQKVPVTFGVKGGFNISSIGGDYDDTEARFGGIVGMTTDISFTKSFYLATGLEVTNKGAKFEDNWYSNDGSINAVYLQMPIHIGYKLIPNEKIKILFHGGTYFAYGIAGKSDDGYYKANTFDYVLKRFDMGIGTGVGLELGHLAFDINWDLGLLDVSRTSDNVTNFSFYVTAGYKF